VEEEVRAGLEDTLVAAVRTPVTGTSAQGDAVTVSITTQLASMVGCSQVAQALGTAIAADGPLLSSIESDLRSVDSNSKILQATLVDNSDCVPRLELQIQKSALAQQDSIVNEIDEDTIMAKLRRHVSRSIVSINVDVQAADFMAAQSSIAVTAGFDTVSADHSIEQLNTFDQEMCAFFNNNKGTLNSRIKARFQQNSQLSFYADVVSLPGMLC